MLLLLNILTSTLIFTLLMAPLSGGRIRPATTQQVKASISNKQEMSNYDFGVLLDTTLPQGGYLEVTFPNQYPAQLGINSTNPLKCSQTCTRVGRVVSLYFPMDLVPNTAHNFTIYNIINPFYSGGTGNFWIKSIKGAQTIDENLIFRVLGIANDIGTITTASVTLDSEGVQYAGQSSRYVFVFRTSRLIPNNNFVRLYLPPNEFELAQFPACSAYPVSGKIVSGRLVCEAFNNEYIDVRGFVDRFVENTDIGIVITMRNPKYAHITNKFGVALIREFTQIMYDRKLDIPGVTVTPGIISNVVIKQRDSDITLTRNKIMRFELKFKLSNELFSGSMLKIGFPASFKIYAIDILKVPITYWVDFGLQDISEDNPLTTEYDPVNDILKILNYKPKLTPDEIVIKFWATSPDNPGESSPLEITTFTDVVETYVVDLDKQFAKINVTDVPTPTSSSVQLSEDFSGLVNPIDITYTFNPEKSVPANGFINIIFDKRLIVNEVDISKCLIYSTATGDLVQAQTCFKRNREIAVQLGSEQFTAGTDWKVKLVGLVVSPSLSGEYITDVTFFQEDATTRLNSYTQIIRFRAAKLIFPDIKIYPNERGQKGVIDVEATVPFDIPVSRPQNVTTETVSFIYVAIQPSGPTSLLGDLGYTSYGSGNLPCIAVFGLTPVTGSQVNCTVATGSQPGVIVKNYQPIKAGTRMRLLIGDFLNPEGNIVVNVMFIRKFNRLIDIITSIQETIQIDLPSTIPATFDTSSQNRTTFYTVNDQEVFHEFEIQFNMNSKKTVNGGERMIFKFPNFDSGFIQLDKKPICLINDLPFTCHGIPFSDWIVLELRNFESVAQSNDVLLKFQNLKWPRIENPSPGSLVMVVASAAKKTVGVYKYSEFLTATPSKFSRIALVQDKKRRLDIDCRYTFSFTTVSGIPNGGTLQLNFPNQYNLIISDPKVRVSYPDFKDANSTNKLSYFYTANKLKVSNIGEVARGATFKIVFNGIRSPDFEGVMSDWFIDTLFNEFSLSRQEDFISVALDKPGTPANLTLLNFGAFPLNADAKASFFFDIQTFNKLSIGTEISITFPDQFKSLPSPLLCEISGGITTFEKCYQSFNSVVMRMDSDYEISSGKFRIVVRNVVNGDEGLTDPFEISAKYDDVDLEISPVELKEKRRLNITAKASTIRLIGSDINPQNEAELSTYTITFLPTNNIEFLQEIVFIFPIQFDQTLGVKLACKATSGLASEISCTRLEDRVLYIDGVDSYEVSEERPITIEISGMINPNIQTNTPEGISIGIKPQGSSSMTDYTEGAVVVSPLNPPGWAFFYSFESTNTDCRYTADYTLNFTATASIPKLSSKGAIILDLPTQFEIDSKIVTTVSYSDEFGKALNSEVKRNRVWIDGNTNDFQGNLQLKVRRIDNPIDEVTSDNFVIRTYDGINKKVIERSFENLDPFYKTYKYPGPLIIVNENKPIVIARGTQSPDIPIYIQGLASLNLTLVPTLPGFQVLPFEVNLHIGEQTNHFRISVAKDFAEGTYKVPWNITGELIPPIYTPIKTSIVQVIRVSEVVVEIQPISNIPFGGQSMPVFFRVSRAPDIGFSIQVNLKKLYKGLNLTTSRLEFNAGDTEKFFRIVFTDRDAAAQEGLEIGAVDIQLSGVNQDLYSLPFSTMFFNVTTQEVQNPTIANFTQDSTGKTSANFTITPSEACYIYYMSALAGTVEPKRVELEAFGPPVDNATRSTYGVTYAFDGNLTTKIGLSKLEPQIEYVLYVLLVNKAGKAAVNMTAYNFKTRDRENAADVSIRLKQSYISPFDSRKALEMVALVLSLDSKFVIESKYQFIKEINAISTTRRLLPYSGDGTEEFTEKSVEGSTKVTQITTLLSFNIISVINSELYPTPKELGEKLNNKKLELAARIDNFDPTYSMPSSEFVKYYPNFVTPPAVVAYSWENVTITTRLNNFGWIFAVVIERESKMRSNEMPSALQIQLGLDSQNLRVPSNMTEVEKTYQFYNLTIYNLTELTPYSVFVIGGNAHPGYPDLMEDKFITRIDFNSLEAPKRKFFIFFEFFVYFFS